MTDWTTVCALDTIEEEGAFRFDHAGATYAIYRTMDGEVFCTAGLCTHEEIHLAEGFVDGYEIECPKHSGVFDIRSGEAKRLPACVNLRTYPARVENGQVQIQV